jgi:flagellin-specific chaperone FliS
VDFKRLSIWAGTAETLGKAVVAVLAMLAAIWVAASKLLDPLGLPEWASRAGILLVLVACGWWLFLQGYRRYASWSRIEQPDAFTLSPSGPTSLIGRAKDLSQLISSVKRSCLVLMDGESGCGKSALVHAGLAVQLKMQRDSLLPIVIGDWGDDWVQGPLATTLDSLFLSLSEPDRTLLGWASAPDLTAAVPDMLRDLEWRLTAVEETLGFKPLLITDQFDDYQARHRARFLDGDENWISPQTLRESNPFWNLIATFLSTRRLHLLIVTRADAAAGLASVRFLGDEQTAARTLPRVDAEYLRPLLASLTPEGAGQGSVSNPEAGWYDLRDRLERDLKAEGAILMQQVRTVLHGLRQLEWLTLEAYKVAGGLRGVEVLVVSRALRHAADAVGGGQSSVQLVRRMVGSFVRPDESNNAPRGQRVSLLTLAAIAGSTPEMALSLLGILHAEEIVRPASSGGLDAWQLDHDYLARAIRAEARQGNRWNLALREGQLRYDQADTLRSRWMALLDVSTLSRICWERARGRLQFGQALHYARISAVKPLAIFLCVISAGIVGVIGYRDRALTLEARQIIDRFGGVDEESAVMQDWRAPPRLRQRVHDLVFADSSRLDRALRSNWPLADSGFEPARLRQSVGALRMRLAQEQTDVIADSLAARYLSMVGRLSDARDVEAEAKAMFNLVEDPKNERTSYILAQTYAGAVSLLSNSTEYPVAARVLRTLMEREPDKDDIDDLAISYVEVARGLTKPEDAKIEAAAIRPLLAQGTVDSLTLADAYVAIAPHLSETDLKDEAVAVLAQLDRATDITATKSLVEALGAVVARLSDPSELRAATDVLGARLKQEGGGLYAENIAEVYSSVAARLADDHELRTMMTTVRIRMERAGDENEATTLSHAYIRLAAHLNDEAGLTTEATALRAWLAQDPDTRHATIVSSSFAEVVSRLPDAPALTDAEGMLRTRLEQETDDSRASAFALAYAKVASRLKDIAILNSASTLLLKRLEHAEDSTDADNFATAYASVAARLTDRDKIHADVTLLRARLEEERDGSLSNPIAAAYAAITARLERAADLKAEEAALRARLAREPFGFIPNHQSQGYFGIEARLTAATALREQVAQFREHMEWMQSGTVAGALAQAYASVAARLVTTEELKEALAVLRMRLESEQDSVVATEIATGYATLIASLAERSDEGERSRLSVELLTLASHPYLRSNVLAPAFKPLAAADFASIDAPGVAVHWAVKKYGIKPDELYPSP